LLGIRDATEVVAAGLASVSIGLRARYMECENTFDLYRPPCA